MSVIQKLWKNKSNKLEPKKSYEEQWVEELAKKKLIDPSKANSYKEWRKTYKMPDPHEKKNGFKEWEKNVEKLKMSKEDYEKWLRGEPLPKKKEDDDKCGSDSDSLDESEDTTSTSSPSDY